MGIIRCKPPAILSPGRIPRMELGDGAKSLFIRPIRLVTFKPFQTSACLAGAQHNGEPPLGRPVGNTRTQRGARDGCRINRRVPRRASIQVRRSLAIRRRDRQASAQAGSFSVMLGNISAWSCCNVAAGDSHLCGSKGHQILRHAAILSDSVVSSVTAAGTLAHTIAGASVRKGATEDVHNTLRGAWRAALGGLSGRGG
jgi:hypothetical protein